MAPYEEAGFELEENKMSGAAEGETGVEVCANCGAAAVDEMKLTECDDCDLVRYCSDKCKEYHLQQHNEECKKRAAELLHDEILFSQPESNYPGDCPICFLPLPHDPQKSGFYPCCSKLICYGCVFANLLSNLGDVEKVLSLAYSVELRVQMTMKKLTGNS